jgi:hypothetical protein
METLSTFFNIYRYKRESYSLGHSKNLNHINMNNYYSEIPINSVEQTTLLIMSR